MNRSPTWLRSHPNPGNTMLNSITAQPDIKLRAAGTHYLAEFQS